MREILYRGRRVDNGEWVKGFYVGPMGCTGVKHSKYFIYFASGPRIEVDPATVGQFTGLRDREGTRIFEGDVLGEYMDEQWGEYGTVHYYDQKDCFLSGRFYIGDDNGSMNDWTYEDDAMPEYWHLLTVIGNIHDQQEEGNGN